MAFERIRKALAAVPPKRHPAPTAAVAVILTPKLDLLLIRRAEHPSDPWSGQMGLPGGSRDPGDADMRATAEREALEEISVDLSSAELLGELDDLAPRTPTLPPVVVRPFVFGVARRPEAKNSEEVAGHEWVALEDLPKKTGKTQVKIRGAVLKVDAFLVTEPPVWGMTYRMISGLLERMK